MKRPEDSTIFNMRTEPGPRKGEMNTTSDCDWGGPVGTPIPKDGGKVVRRESRKGWDNVYARK